VVQIGKNVQRILPLGKIIVCGVFELTTATFPPVDTDCWWR
jgi:hypothetical protein